MSSALQGFRGSRARGGFPPWKLQNTQNISEHIPKAKKYPKYPFRNMPEYAKEALPCPFPRTLARRPPAPASLGPKATGSVPDISRYFGGVFSYLNALENVASGRYIRGIIIRNFGGVPISEPIHDTQHQLKEMISLLRAQRPFAQSAPIFYRHSDRLRIPRGLK